MKFFIKIIRRYKFTFFLAVISGILSGASFSGLISTITNAIDTEFNQPYITSLKFITTWISYGLFGIVSKHCVQKLSQQFVFDLRIEITQKILNRPLIDIETFGSRSLVALTTDINTLAFTLEQIPSLLSAVAIIFCCSISYIIISPVLFLFMAILIVCFLLLIVPSRKKTQLYRQEVHHEMNVIFNYIHQLHQGIKELLLSMSKRNVFFQERLYPACERYRQKSIEAYLIENIGSQYAGDLFLLLALGLSIIIFPKLGYATFQEIKKFLLLFLFISPSLKIILRSSNYLQRAKISLNQIESLYLSISFDSELSMVKLSDDQKNFDRHFRSLILEKVSYNYKNFDHTFVLGPVSLAFSNPEIVFIIGGNGSGKSTLVKLLCGLYFCDTGQIKLNHQDITEMNRDNYRQYFSVLFADGFLFQDLLEKKNFYSNEEMVKWNQYLNILKLSDKVRIQNGQFSTIQLSVGQQKRLSLLVALMENSEIYIFDEWAANQDLEFKEFFYYKILPDLQAKGKLVIVISHDDRYYDIADRIIKLENGIILSDIVMTPAI